VTFFLRHSVEILAPEVKQYGPFVKITPYQIEFLCHLNNVHVFCPYSHSFPARRPM